MFKYKAAVENTRHLSPLLATAVLVGLGQALNELDGSQSPEVDKFVARAEEVAAEFIHALTDAGIVD